MFSNELILAKRWKARQRQRAARRGKGSNPKRHQPQKAQSDPKQI